jgi:hypothetical protein
VGDSKTSAGQDVNAMSRSLQVKGSFLQFLEKWLVEIYFNFISS